MIRSILILALCISGLSAANVTVDVDKQHQTIEGFGTCLVSWGKTGRSDFYNEEMARVYSTEMGYNMLRVNIAPWAYPKTENADDISWKNIDIDHKKNQRVKVFIEFAKKLQKYDPNLRIIGSVWSPPAWMKINNEITGGKGKKKETSIHGHSYKKKGRTSKNRVDPKYYQHFCNLMVAMADLHKEHGVPFYALSPGNEVMFSQEFESCVWTAKDFATITAMLGEALNKNGYEDIVLFGPETMTKHNWSNANPLYIKELQNNKQAWEHIDRFATHGYVDGFAADMSADSSVAYWKLVQQYDKPVWMTEGGTGDHDWPKPLTGVAAGVHNSLVHGNTSAFVPWQVASANGQRNHHALMAGREMTKKTHAMRHFSYFINAGAVRVDASCDSSGLLSSAFKHPESKRLCVVIINPGEKEEQITLKLENDDSKALTVYRTSASEDLKKIEDLAVKSGSVAFKLPAQSMVSLISN